MEQKNLWEQIWQIIDTEKKASPQYLIAQEIITCVNNGKKLNITEIAKNTFNSKPTITRFCQSFGFEGFKDFVKALMEEENFYFFPVKAKSAHESYQDYINFTRKLYGNIDKQNHVIIKITETIIKYKRIFIFASPENNLAANSFAQKLQCLGFQVFSSINNKLMLMLNSFSESDLAIFLVSGYSNSTLVQLWHYINPIAQTILIGTKSQIPKFDNRQITLSLELSPFILYDQIKDALMSYALDQINNVLVNSNQSLVDIFMSPKYRI